MSAAERVYVIEARNPDNTLNFDEPSPMKFFGSRCINGITEDEIAQVVWRHYPEAVLRGDEFHHWAARLDDRFVTREKRW